MDGYERQNFAVFRAGASDAIDKVRISKEPLIIQRHNKDIAAVVTLEDLQLIASAKKNGQAK